MAKRALCIGINMARRSDRREPCLWSKSASAADSSFWSAVAVAAALLDKEQAMIPPPEDRVEAEGDGMETLR